MKKKKKIVPLHRIGYLAPKNAIVKCRQTTDLKGVEGGYANATIRPFLVPHQYIVQL